MIEFLTALELFPSSQSLSESLLLLFSTIWQLLLAFPFAAACPFCTTDLFPAIPLSQLARVEVRPVIRVRNRIPEVT